MVPVRQQVLRRPLVRRLYSLFWNFTDDYFSILDGKRLYGLIAAGSSAGSMLGGGLVTGLSVIVPASKLFLVWSVVGIVTFPLFLIVLRRFRPIASAVAQSEALKRHWAGWNCFFFTADLRLPKLVGLKPSRKSPLFNGPLECRLFEIRMVAGSNRKNAVPVTD